jgi:hypothetical protein
MNPHSTWPAIMYIYNLHPCFCHKRKYLLLTTLISGPKQADIDIDVSLEPLVEDMQKLWEHGVNVRDEYRKEHFNLKAIISTRSMTIPHAWPLHGRSKER